MFTASKTQVATYLLGVCPFSIAFLVFLNSSVSFVASDLLGVSEGKGDIVGTLGFADELLALVACPAWGVFSDRIGVRAVCVVGYSIVGLSLLLFVQAKNVYPQLLLGRLFFSLGASAVSTMVTAILPAMSRPVASSQKEDGPGPGADRIDSTHQASPTAVVTGLPSSSANAARDDSSVSSPRVAGLVGICAGCGALLALGLLLPLPARLQNAGASPAKALQESYYIVATIAFLVAIACFFGFKDLPGEEGKGIRLPRRRSRDADRPGGGCSQALTNSGQRLFAAFILAFRNTDIALAYLGGFVARASSVGLSLFVPLLVNGHFQRSGLCANTSRELPGGLPDIKERCPKAYILAAQLTGVGSLVGLIVAHPFGYFSSKSRRLHVPVMVAAAIGIFGYSLLATHFEPERHNGRASISDYVAMSGVGASQIGAVVTSLAVLSSAVLKVQKQWDLRIPSGLGIGAAREEGDGDEAENLLPATSARPTLDFADIKGSIAGMYSLFGGAGILLLTKLGGYLFDKLSFGAPLYILALFNGILLMTGLALASAKIIIREREAI